MKDVKVECVCWKECGTRPSSSSWTRGILRCFGGEDRKMRGVVWIRVQDVKVERVCCKEDAEVAVVPVP
eukprot:3940272-Rhodomonas_salina.3